VTVSERNVNGLGGSGGRQGNGGPVLGGAATVGEHLWI
jgi:hypothetical protein